MKKLTIIILLLSPVLVKSQDIACYFVKGEITLEGGNGNTRKLIKNDILDKHEKVILHENATLTIINAEGKFYSISKEGNYTYQQLVKKIEATDADISGKYFAYVWKKINTHKEHDPDKLAMNVVGGVSRAESLAMQEPFNSSVVVNTPVHFIWEELPENGHFFLLDSAFNTLLKMRIESTGFTIFPKESGLKEGTYYWTVSVNSKMPTTKNACFQFTIPDQTWIEQYSKEKRALINTISSFSNHEEERELLEEFDLDKGVYTYQH